MQTMASLDQRSSSTQPTKVVEFGTRHSAVQPVRPRISKESTPWLPTGARRGGQPLMGPPPSPVLAPLLVAGGVLLRAASIAARCHHWQLGRAAESAEPRCSALV